MTISSPSARYVSRHIGPNETERAAMLKRVGYASLEELLDAAVPPGLSPKIFLNPRIRCRRKRR